MKNFLSENNFLIFFLLILGISIMNVMKIVKIGLMASISSNLIHSDWCELCFSDYKEINPPESNLAEEAQKIKESNNKPKNNDDTNIKKIKTNRTEDKSKTSTREEETKEKCDTIKDEIIPEGIEMNNEMLAGISSITPIDDTKNNSSYEGSCDKDFNPKTEIEGLDRNDCSTSSKDINTNTREGINTNTRKYFPNNREDFSNNNASNIDKNSIINTGENPIINNEEFAATNSENGEVARNNSKVDEDYFRHETYNNGKE